MIKHLAKKHAIVVASLAHSSQELNEGAALKNYCEDVVAEVVPDWMRWTHAFRALPTLTPSSVAYFWSRRLHHRIKERLFNSSFDVILAHCAFVAQYVANWRGCFRILDFGDLDSAKWAEYARSRGLPASLSYGLESKKLRSYERGVARQFHRCTVTTQGEMEEFQKLGVSVPCRVIPNGVDASFFRCDRVGAGRRRTIIFLGRMDYYPNIDGAWYFAKTILPLVRERAPDVEFHIVGSNPSRKIRDLAKIPGVVVTGHVRDVRPHVKEAAVSVAPLRIARGTQNKILESMAMGVPVVASPQAAKGIQAVPGKHVLVADEPAAFAGHVIDVLESSRLQEQLSAMGRALVKRMHEWSASMRILDEVLESQDALRA